jgi:hypothetical protein
MPLLQGIIKKKDLREPEKTKENALQNLPLKKEQIMLVLPEEIITQEEETKIILKEAAGSLIISIQNAIQRQL